MVMEYFRAIRLSPTNRSFINDESGNRADGPSHMNHSAQIITKGIYLFLDTGCDVYSIASWGDGYMGRNDSPPSLPLIAVIPRLWGDAVAS